LAGLFREHYRSLVGLARSLVDDQAAEDVVQDAFVQLFRARKRLTDPTAAPSYLRVTVVNLARSRLRRRLLRRRHLWVAPQEARSAEDQVVLRRDRDEVLAALRLLPRRQRECLVLRYFLDLSEAEMASMLGISNGAVKSHSHRGLARLATILEVE
jgi:RNA polymerase sigma-70 factor (sigma-E family)